MKDKIGIERLKVIDRLEIGPVQLNSKRVKTPYVIHQDGKSDMMELEYRFEEDVFDPDETASLNLASMMTAQVALNYAMFCNEMIFHGPFGKVDRRFITEMAENTAREIFVKKILQPNPFLTGDAAMVAPEKRDSYVQAKIHFESTIEGGETAWNPNFNRYAVLSSGGKDSLLSYGLMKDMGYETHPVFINESGRHWYTALNAYRYFKRSYSETARVWTNSDRIFSWMLRHMPFIRSDFANVRSDEYPIRLWTVAVFLFGALPILRKRGLGRLLIGDEFDTSVRLSYKGITHYDGLFDQSVWFDRAMSRYFIRKKWGVTQLSILRPLSELLIEKILAKRYPEHQRHQVSCHAAHIEGDRVYPCGKCEKCRRIVGMLTALDVDPSHCGYRPNQIDDSLKSLAGKGIHQEAEGAHHLLHMLIKRGILQASGNDVQPHPEIMMLRFHPVKSPINEIPLDLRKPLLNILLKYSDGALKKIGREWENIDILSSPMLDEPYLFEESQPGEFRDSGKPNHGYLLGELTWPEARQKFREVDVALLPVGAIEQHGPHLPLDTDAFDAEYLAHRVAERCVDPKPVVLPLVSYGVSYHHDDFSGTISVTNETLSRLIYEIGMSAAKHGIKKLMVINGHGGNDPALQFAAQMINRDAHIFTCVDSGETSDPDIEAITETGNDVHAGEIETSTSLAVRPELVKLKSARKSVPKFSSRYLNFSSRRSVEWYARTSKISASGVMGDPLKANRKKGEEIWALMINNLVEFVEELKRMSLEEIYQKRY